MVGMYLVFGLVKCITQFYHTGTSRFLFKYVLLWGAYRFRTSSDVLCVSMQLDAELRRMALVYFCTQCVRRCECWKINS